MSGSWVHFSAIAGANFGAIRGVACSEVTWFILAESQCVASASNSIAVVANYCCTIFSGPSRGALAFSRINAFASVRTFIFDAFAISVPVIGTRPSVIG